MNDALIGIIFGGAISIITTYFNHRALKHSRVLEEKLSIYKNISKTIIEEKLEFESSVGQIALIKNKLSDNKITNDEGHKLFQAEIDRLSVSHNKIYSLFIYSYILEGHTTNKLNELYILLARAMNPTIMLQKEHLQKIEQAFEGVISSLSLSLGIKTQIKIDNPNKLINESLGT